ncbi:restriction endonuclease [Parafrankia sp. EUN1f]|uniref:restriction endonuclease n=1 Tax=Parafrankia sp. EUN1f TaxID=102897 RepID=UPI0001C45DD6|nr:restriction endonuclease [Parafrankia sp. EUN1f]EFC86544.1 restriction endonuclease [Parafrankia sp. EUN1f]
MAAVAFGLVCLALIVQGVAAALGWWTLPLGLLAVAAAIGIWRAVRASRIREIGRRVAVAALDTLSPTEFEHHVADLLTRDGCRRVRVVGGRGDGGVDVLARTPRGAQIAVQCKHYRSRAVGPSEVRDFNGCAWTDHRADIAVMVTSGRFTTAAAEFGERHRIRMIDRELLARWMVGERILPGIPAPRQGHIDVSPIPGEASR